MPDVVVVPFDGGLSSVEALRAACDGVRAHQGSVVAVYVLYVPGQLPLSARLPWLERAAANVCRDAEQIGREAGVTVYAEWVQARDPAIAIVDVADDVGATAVVLGLSTKRHLPRWLPPWSLAGRIMARAHCPVVLRAAPHARPLRRYVASGATA